MPRTKTVKKVVKKKVLVPSREGDEIVTSEAPVQCLRCGGKVHEPNENCDAGK